MLSYVLLFATPLSMKFSRPEYWSGLPGPPPRDLPDPGIEPRSPAFQPDSLPTEPPGNLLYFPVLCNICKCVLSHFSYVQLFVTPGTVAQQALLSIKFSRQEYWSGLPCPPPRDLPDPGIEPRSFMSPAVAGGFFTTSTTWEALHNIYLWLIYFIH